jgi:hypothetical protein
MRAAIVSAVSLALLLLPSAHCQGPATTDCHSYSELHTTGGGGPFGSYIAVAAPAGANIKQFTAEARKAVSDLNTYPWTVCSSGQACLPKGPGSGRVIYQVTEFGFPPPPVWSEPNVKRAYIASYLVLDNVATDLRLSIEYSWDKPYCEALAWNRLEHNFAWPAIRLMVPAGVKITGFGARVRDGNNGATWVECSTNGTQCPFPEFQYDKFQPVQDVAHSMQGYETGTYNGSSCCVRNAEVWVRYLP